MTEMRHKCASSTDERTGTTHPTPKLLLPFRKHQNPTDFKHFQSNQPNSKIFKGKNELIVPKARNVLSPVPPFRFSGEFVTVNLTVRFTLYLNTFDNGRSSDVVAYPPMGWIRPLQEG
jgi:hypothetical protein